VSIVTGFFGLRHHRAQRLANRRACT